MSDNQLIVQNNELQMIPLDQARQWYAAFQQFTASILKKDLDYGTIPGTPKPCLLKAGAEKLRFAYGLGVEFEVIDKVVDFDRPFVDYSYKCTVRSKQGQILSQCEGNCNTMEVKFGYVWLPIADLPEGTDISKLRSKTSGRKITELDFAISKGETGGQYGKPAEYWTMWIEAIEQRKARKITKTTKAGKEMDAWELDSSVTLYRTINPDAVGLKNNIMKMAQKRAFVGAILMATGASEFFTQDIEDMEINGHVYSDKEPVQEAVVVDGYKPVAVGGEWYARTEQCRTVHDVKVLYLKYKVEVDASPELKELFRETRDRIESKPVSGTSKEFAHV